MNKLVLAGFTGDFLGILDLYTGGPLLAVADLTEFVRARARYLSCYDSRQEPSESWYFEDLMQQHQRLDTVTDYQQVRLWFEYDSHDQLTLARILDYLNQRKLYPKDMQLICATHFPGVSRFNGLGHLPPAALRVLWPEFVPVLSPQYELASAVWAAVTDSSPKPLMRLIDSETPAIPPMAKAMHRHLQELPSKQNGLSLTEQTALQILHDKGEMSAGRLFAWYVDHYEQLVFMGDWMFWGLLRNLSNQTHAAIKLIEEGEKPNTWRVSLLPTGEQLLQNNGDWLQMANVDRWLGGVHIQSTNTRNWRYDHSTHAVCYE